MKTSELRRELRDMDDDELYNRLVETRQELFNLKFQSVTGRLDNVARLSQLRREVARIQTIAREREIAMFEDEFASAAAAETRQKVARASVAAAVEVAREAALKEDEHADHEEVGDAESEEANSQSAPIADVAKDDAESGEA